MCNIWHTVAPATTRTSLPLQWIGFFRSNTTNLNPALVTSNTRSSKAFALYKQIRRFTSNEFCSNHIHSVFTGDTWFSTLKQWNLRKQFISFPLTKDERLWEVGKLWTYRGQHKGGYDCLCLVIWSSVVFCCYFSDLGDVVIHYISAFYGVKKK